MTQPITIIAYPVVPADARDAFLGEFARLTRDTRAEPGCLGFQLHEQPEDPEKFAVYEVFADQEAFDAHVAAPHTKRFLDFISSSGSRLSHVAWSAVRN